MSKRSGGRQTTRGESRGEPEAVDSPLPGQLSAHVRDDIVREEEGRLLLSLRVTPRAGRNGLALEDGILRIRVTAAPVEGAANEAVLALLAARLRVPTRDITIVHGATARNKVIAVAGLSATELWDRLRV